MVILSSDLLDVSQEVLEIVRRRRVLSLNNGERSFMLSDNNIALSPLICANTRGRSSNDLRLARGGTGVTAYKTAWSYIFRCTKHA